MRKKCRNQISEISQVRSSPEFVGVRRSSSGFVGAEFLRENAVAKVEKMVKKCDLDFRVLFFHAF